MVFENEAPSDHRMKSSFLFTLWGWAKVTKVDNSISLVGFLAWMGCRGVCVWAHLYSSCVLFGSFVLLFSYI